jgi:hypothetical protein
MVAVAVAAIPVGVIVDKAAGQQADGCDQQQNVLFHVTSWVSRAPCRGQGARIELTAIPVDLTKPKERQDEQDDDDESDDVDDAVHVISFRVA